jgi:hypothetical protein
MVRRDVLCGYIQPRTAAEVYGQVVSDGSVFEEPRVSTTARESKDSPDTTGVGG